MPGAASGALEDSLPRCRLFRRR